MEQESIFGTDFPDVTLRRKDLLPVVAKIYAWAAIVIGTINTLITLLLVILPDSTNDPLISSPINVEVVSAFFSSILFLLMGLPVILEKKKAVRINNVIAVIFITAAVLCMILSANALLMIVLVAVLSPYWIKLRSIQRKWEYEAGQTK
ncbi:hypothetical protein [Chitinophaga sp. sic0106]|uniref:hypothetical protein n=1 Tax=Chitinophaga sp. sic0106 TaxID=2854785 RepID=UPI001C487DC3|nr:hypothetical protein [Chitinophaga sp. sic0106]MBV7532534.1 hypothetical protein [Chitinophaga sp. sic0106]